MLSRTRKPREVNFQKKLHQMAKQLRGRSTSSEQILWKILKGNSRFGVKFRRQWPIDRYIVDFCCLKLKLIIEVDGPIHDQQKDHDTQHDQILSGYYGFTVVRFKNAEIDNNLTEVIKTIQNQ